MQNKALQSWSKHNFIFKQFALLNKQKIIEIKKKVQRNFDYQFRL